MQGLHELQQNEMSIEEYYTAFDRVIDLFSPWFLSVNKGVPAADFEPIRKQLLNAPTTPSSADIYCLPSLLKRHILVLCHLLYQYLCSRGLSKDHHSEGHRL